MHMCCASAINIDSWFYKTQLLKGCGTEWGNPSEHKRENNKAGKGGWQQGFLERNLIAS